MKHARHLTSMILLSTGALAACSAADSTHSETEPAAPAVKKDAIISTDLCTLVRALGDTLRDLTPNDSSVVLNELNCADDRVTNAHYLGAAPVNGTVADLFTAPFVTSNAYFCAIADSDGVTVDGRTGGFGLTSQFNVSRKEPGVGRIVGRRISTINIFGVGAKLGVQDLEWKFDAERSPDNFGGNYMSVISNGRGWNFQGTVAFPVGPMLVTISPEFRSRNGTRSKTNGGLSLLPDRSSNRLASEYLFSNWAPCTTLGCPSTRVTDAQIQADHAVPCAGGVINFTDGNLPFKRPFGGASCASRDFVFTDLQKNWFSYGRAGGIVAEGESPKNISSTSDRNHLENHATFWSALNMKFAFEAFGFGIKLDTRLAIASRDAFAVRQHHGAVLDVPGSSAANVWTDLNAESRADMDITATVEVPLWGPETASFSVNLGDTENRSAPNGNGKYVDIRYPDTATTSFSSYRVNGVLKSNAETARGQCISAPTASKPVVTPDDPGPFIKQVAEAAPRAIHPCNTRVCTGNDTTNFSDFKQQEHVWNPSTLRLEPKKDANGNVIPPTSCTICNTLETNLCLNGVPLNDAATGRPKRIVGKTITPPSANCIR